MAERRALLRLNPNARNGDQDVDAALQRLRDAGLTLVELDPDGPDDVPSCIRRHAYDAELLIAGGGDGTMNSVAEALMDTDLTLGVLPLGTANDLARSLGIPDDLEAAAAIIAEGRTVRIDVSEVNGRPFFNVAHVGIAAEIPRNTSQVEKRYFGPLSYLLAAIRTWRSHRSFNARVQLDGRPQRLRCTQLSVGNGRHFGGGMVIDADARLDSGQLVLSSWKLRSFWRLVLIGLAMRRGQHRYFSEVLQASASAIEIDTDVPLRLTADGEEFGHTPATFRLHPARVAVRVAQDDAGAAHVDG